MSSQPCMICGKFNCKHGEGLMIDNLREELEHIGYQMSPKVEAKLKEMVPKEVIDDILTLFQTYATRQADEARLGTFEFCIRYFKSKAYIMDEHNRLKAKLHNPIEEE